MKMYVHFKLMIIFFLIVVNVFRFSVASVVSTGDFNKDFYVIWSPDHVTTSSDGTERSLSLDQQSGSGFASNQKFLFGKMDMNIKLVPGNSAGTVVAYYLTSDDGGNNIRDEIDFEFLGRVPGEAYVLQTNVFVDGSGNREERIALWFDPTLRFHTYSILWNIHLLVFMVDSIPIRVYKNNADQGVPFPMSQPLAMKATLWNGESWATHGGKAKIEWSTAPFVASFSDYRIDACVSSNAASCMSRSPINWWNYGGFGTLTSTQWRFYKWVRLHHMVYDYCRDGERFQNNLPKECSLPKY